MSEGDETSRIDESVVDAIVQLSFTVTALLSRHAASNDMSLTQLRLLGILRDREPRMGDLAAHLGLDRSTVSGLIDRAVARGLVERVADETDRRSSRVRLTVAGQELAGVATRSVVTDLTPLISRVPPGEREQLARRLRQLVASST